VFVLDDVQLDRRGQIKPPGWWLEAHNGREGSTRLLEAHTARRESDQRQLIRVASRSSTTTH